MGLTGAYVALPVAPENFGRCVETLPLMGFAGANVTVPHKEAAFALSATLDEDARATGAVNTLIFARRRGQGHEHRCPRFRGQPCGVLGERTAASGPAVVLGAGGAARAVILALARAGAPEIRVANRTKARADALAAALGSVAKISTLDWATGPALFPGRGCW